MAIDFQLYPILCVDDDPAVLTTYRYALEERFSVLTASSGAAALDVLRTRDVAVLFADQRMPEMTGVEVCVQARRLRPEMVRILVTAYSDIREAVDAINRAQVTRYISKPWDHQKLLLVAEAAIEFVHAQRSARAVEARLVGGAPSQLAAVIGEEILHEVRKPLTAMKMHVGEGERRLQAALAAVPAGLGPDARRAIEDAVTAQRHVAGAVEHLAAVCARLGGELGAGAEPPEPATCDLAGVVRAIVNLLRPQIEAAALVDVRLEASPTVRAPASLVGQILINLLLNAVQALRGEHDTAPRRASRADGGTGGSLVPAIHVRVGVEGHEAVIAVTDNGPGLDAGQVERMFEPRFTTRAGGAGLGLAVVRELARRVGGQVAVTSNRGRGTTFQLTLPLDRVAR
jgi:signal transduction histidine kinase